MTSCPETAARIAGQIASDRAAAKQAADDAAWAATIPEPIRRKRARVSQAQLDDFYSLTTGLPDYVRKPLLARWHRIRKATEQGALAAANGFVRDFVASARAASDNLPLAMADDELASYARTNAEECGRIIAQADAGEVRSILIEGKLCRQPRFVLEALIKAIDAGVLPDLNRMGARALDQLPKRLADEKWWRGRLKRFVTRAVEQLMIRLGCVNRDRAAFMSEGSFKRMRGRDQRNAKALALAEATNEKGQTYTLAELSRRTVANPVIRRTELMVRILGTEEVMNGLGYASYFLTITAPSKYHRTSKGGPNPKYGANGNPEYSPRETQDYLCENWAECRALFKKKAHPIQVYGVRVVEPHHDGTPHWHMLIWVAPHQSERMLHSIGRLPARGSSQSAEQPDPIPAANGNRTGQGQRCLARFQARNQAASGVLWPPYRPEHPGNGAALHPNREGILVCQERYIARLSVFG
ncbi:replication endonuclease [Jeongeupia naejangsanensis]|uniref:Replication endonuclease n=1 Tax=Jeongeupia naejangsanensis TaxID=613195 RepID=A0ABS2BH97_9NEIS|nr:replication endonuclease [Jeongeupia naejangsanensis]MBM3114976.1 replication endonuclease [Jeongeupia naejangsanensis]